MCFSPKIKTPKMDTNQIRAVEPAPLTQEVSNVAFGGSDEDNSTDSTEVSGRKSLKVEKDDSVAKSKANGSRTKSAIRKSVFGGKR